MTPPKSAVHQRIALASEALAHALLLLDGRESRLYENVLDALEAARCECDRAYELQRLVQRVVAEAMAKGLPL
jgi:hypothetical protein